VLRISKAPPSAQISGPHLQQVTLGDRKAAVCFSVHHEESHHVYQGLVFDANDNCNGEKFPGLLADEFDEFPVRQ
jgi:hypothetical protein